MKNLPIADLRRNYARQKFDEQDAAADPFEQFEKWFTEARESQILEPNAMFLATANHRRQPSVRTVLLKDFDQRGFVFYTNYESRKSQELAENPQAALLFNWLELERQIRIEGKVEKVGAEESEKYFQSRPKGSQIGAWASPQSQVIASREILEKNVAAFATQFEKEEKLPLPDFWGGFRLVPTNFEFWQGRESRLHDRIRYSKSRKNWQKERLAP